MEPTDLTVTILREIRDSIRETNARVDQTNARLDTVADRIVGSEIRTATAITALAGTLDEVKRLLTERLDLRNRLERCEQDIILIKERTGIH